MRIGVGGKHNVCGMANNFSYRHMKSKYVVLLKYSHQVQIMDTFKTILPKDKNLSKWIAYYYFHKSNDENFSKDIIYHPHYLVALNVYKNVRIEVNKNGRTYVPVKHDSKEIIITINNRTSKQVRLRGAFNKIGVVFNPLGINHFINHPLSKIVSNNRVSSFEYFGENFSNTSNLVFSESSIESKGKLLDAFFKIHFKNFEDERVKKAIDIILNSSEIPKVQELAKNLFISRKTLLRLFRMHLCFSVEEFKSIIKFRKALQFYEEAINKPTFTQVAHDNRYYDQSEFINHFKSITSFNPKKFFSSINNISNNGTYWTFKED